MVADEAAEQLELEIVRRLRVLALVCTPEATDVIEQAMLIPGLQAPQWVELLTSEDREAAQRAATGIRDALWPGGPPESVSGTPLGRLLAAAA